MDLSPIVGLVSFQTITLGVIAIFGSAATVYVGWKGAEYIHRAIRGADSSGSVECSACEGSGTYAPLQTDCSTCGGTGYLDWDARDSYVDEPEDSHAHVDFLCDCGWHGDAIDCEQGQDDDGEMTLECPSCGRKLSD